MPSNEDLESQVRHLQIELERTQRKERAAAIKELKWQWQTTFDSIGSSVCVLDDNFRVLQCNKATLRLMGKRQDDIIGRKCFELVHGTTQPHEHCPVKRLEKSLKREIEVLKVGESWVEVAVDPILDDQGGLKGIVHIVTDITEHKKAAEFIEQSESALHLFKSALEASSDAIGMSTPEGKHWYQNRAFDDLFGHIGDAGAVVYCDQRIAEEVFRTIMAGGSWSGEVAMYGKGGEKLQILLRAYAVTDQAGKITNLVGVHTDITERKRFEADLLHSEHRFRALAELLPQTVFEMEMDGRLTFVNNAAFKIFGYSNSDFEKGLNAMDMIIAEDRPRVLDAIQQILHGISGHDGWRFTALRKDGSTFPVLIYSSVNSEETDNTGLRGIIIDISEQEQLAREKNKLEEQYIQVQKMEAIGCLAGGVAHDLNNMLSPILGYGELLLDMVSPDAPGRRAVEQILSAGLRAKDMVRQLLAFSRKQALEIKSINLNQVLAGFESLLDRILRDDIQLELKLSRGVPEILADTGQIEQVVMNLAVNAQDAMPDGGKITIEVGAVDLRDNDIEHYQLLHAGRFVVMTISDTGHGMDADTKERIFDPFFTTKGQGKGTGLGLSTVYGIIKQHNGSIRVYSEPGMGTVFKIHFPAAPDQPKEVSEERMESVILTGTEHILIAEDNHAVRMLAENILNKFGYQTVTVNGVAECVELLAQSRYFDLLLTDVVLQDTNGKELYNQVRAYIPKIKVIYMSGYTDDVIVHHGVLEKGISFIQKPFSVQDLLKKVRVVLDEN